MAQSDPTTDHNEIPNFTSSVGLLREAAGLTLEELAVRMTEIFRTVPEFVDMDELEVDHIKELENGNSVL